MTKLAALAPMLAKAGGGAAAASGAAKGAQTYLSLLDMIDGGGAGKSGQKFEGGGFSDFLNTAGVRPFGYKPMDPPVAQVQAALGQQGTTTAPGPRRRRDERPTPNPHPPVWSPPTPNPHPPALPPTQGPPMPHQATVTVPGGNQTQMMNDEMLRVISNMDPRDPATQAAFRAWEQQYRLNQ